MVVVWVLLWAVDAQRGQCSLAVREAERLAVQRGWQGEEYGAFAEWNQPQHIVG